MKRRGFRRSSVEDEVDDEFAFHFEMTIRELMEQGMTRSEARTEAERRFGDVESVRRESRRYGAERDRKADRAEYWVELRQDIAFAVRHLAKARGFAAVAIVTLALGIGATAAVFSALDAVVLRALPFDHPERITELRTTRRGEESTPSAAEWAALRRGDVFDGVAAAILGSGTTMQLTDVPEIVPSGRVSTDYFRVFAVQPELGRTFTVEEDTPGQAKVAIISHRLWVSRFNSDRGVIGRTLQLEGLPHTIVGVMPAAFDFTRSSEDVWLPLALTAEQLAHFTSRYLVVFARLRPGVSLATARSSATAVERAAIERMPERTDPVSDWGVNVVEFSKQLVGDYAALLLVLLGAVGFVLLISCTNVANLLLARGSARAKELAIRSALGAGRGRLVRQLLTESLVLGVTGAMVGLVVAYGLLHVILAVSPENIPRLEQAAISWRVLGFTLALGVLCCLLFGLLPAVRVAGPGLQTTLREGGRQSGGVRDRLRGALVSAEVALAITLLVGSGLLIRSAWIMQHVDPGFDPRGVLTARLVLPETRYPNGEAVIRAYSTIRDQAAAIPGVKYAALVSVVPMSGSSMQSSIAAEGDDRDSKRPTADLRLAGPGYFDAMGMRLIAGRDIAKYDNATAPLVVVVSEALVKKLWPTLSPREVLGKRLDGITGRRSTPHLMEIVGVVSDLHDTGLGDPPKPTFYAPVDQTPEKLWTFMQRSLVVVVRADAQNADPEMLVKPLRRAVAQFDASLPLADSRTMKSLLRGSLETARMNTLLLSILGAIALVLAMVGIYGVVSYFVSQRTHEIGVRMALGADPARIWQYVVRRGLTPIAIGLVLGLALSSITTTVLRGQLFQVSAHDPATLGTVALLLLLVGLVATYVPARRAMRVPPVVALNEG